MLTIHASRSRYEAYMRCPRYGFLQFNYKGRGIVRNSKSIFLTTGGWLHKGLELIGKWIQKNRKDGHKSVPEYALVHICKLVRNGYFNEVFPEGWQDNGGGFFVNDEIEVEGEIRKLTEYEFIQLQQYIFNEQTCMIEGFLRVFNLRTLPIWMQKYTITSIEQDLSFQLAKGEGFEVIQNARIDWVLQEIESKDLVLVSFKGYRTYGNHEAKVASHDTQGISESWAFDEFLKQKKIDKKIMGVKMVYFIKGARKDYGYTGRMEQQNALVRGWRKLTSDGPEYAFSWTFPNPDNASGYGYLGKAWDSFKVFEGEGLEEIGGIKKWVELLDSGNVQPECGDPFEKLIVQPEVYLRGEQETNEWLLETISKEKEIARKIQCVLAADTSPEELEVELAKSFPKNRQACHYYPGEWNDCPYISVCHGTEEERFHPLDNGFVFRTPHHKAELIQIHIQKFVNVATANN